MLSANHMLGITLSVFLVLTQLIIKPPYEIGTILFPW